MKYREPITQAESSIFAFLLAAIVVGLAIGAVLRAYQL
jgi:hypothetical protein